jgi:hypothetical protein
VRAERDHAVGPPTLGRGRQELDHGTILVGSGAPRDHIDAAARRLGTSAASEPEFGTERRGCRAGPHQRTARWL